MKGKFYSYTTKYIDLYDLRVLWKDRWSLRFRIDDYERFNSPYAYTKKGEEVHRRANLLRVVEFSKNEKLIKEIFKLKINKQFDGPCS